MQFVETSFFTAGIQGLVDDEGYRQLQAALMARPEVGALIRGSGGLRKVRWGMGSKGKRGGLRIIYYWHKREDTFYMLFAYEKSDQRDLTVAQLRVLKRWVQEEAR